MTLEKPSNATVVVVPNASTSPNKENIFSWHGVGFSVPIGKKEQKTLVQNMSGSIKSGQVLGIMGSSGAGKSTLLNILAGRLGQGELTGRILLNGQPRNPKTWTQDCSFVEQDDLMYTHLTVEETLGYSAKLRLPSSMSPAEKQGKVEDAIMDLGLNSARKTIIGNSEIKGVSGGERKRVSIGVELITEPSILFMDEPTSGLDAFTAFNIVDAIKKLAARRGMIVIMTIHQPRTDILELFDKILLLSVGKMLWFGELNNALSHFAKQGYPLPPKTNPSDFFLDITTLDQRSDELQQKSLVRINKFISAWEERDDKTLYGDQDSIGHSQSSPSGRKTPSSSLFATSWLNECQVLLIRDFKDSIRSLPNLIAILLESVITMFLLGFIFFQSSNDSQGAQSKIGLLFFMCINMTFSIVVPQISIFPLQRLVIRRERAAGSYRASSAFVAKWISTLPLVFLSSLLLILPVYWMVGLRNDPIRYCVFVGILLVHANAANSLGLLISSAVKDVQMGQILGPLVVTVFLLFGGPLVSLSATPVVFRWIQYISIISISNKALAQNEFIGVTLRCTDPNVVCYENGQQVLDSFSLGSPSIAVNVGSNIVISFGFLFMAYVLFSHTSRPALRLK